MAAEETAKQQTKTYKDVLKAPKVGRKQVQPRDLEKVVLVYPTDENKTDSEATKKIVVESLAPKSEGIQIRALRKVQKGGVVVESGTKSGAIKIREITNKIPSLKIVAPKQLNPRVMIYDVDRSLTDEEIKSCVWKQNLEGTGITEEKLNKGFNIVFKTGRRDLDVVNLVIEMDPEIRIPLMEAGRVYIDFAACRIVDHLSVSRCFRCQGYGHVAKVCKKDERECVCSHCGRAGHEYKECRRAISGEKPSCANCLAAKKPADHRVGTIDCPMYRRLVEQRIAKTTY